MKKIPERVHHQNVRCLAKFSLEEYRAKQKKGTLYYLTRRYFSSESAPMDPPPTSGVGSLTEKQKAEREVHTIPRGGLDAFVTQILGRDDCLGIVPLTRSVQRRLGQRCSLVAEGELIGIEGAQSIYHVYR